MPVNRSDRSATRCQSGGTAVGGAHRGLRAQQRRARSLRPVSAGARASGSTRRIEEAMTEGQQRRDADGVWRRGKPFRQAGVAVCKRLWLPWRRQRCWVASKVSPQALDQVDFRLLQRERLYRARTSCWTVSQLLSITRRASQSLARSSAPPPHLSRTARFGPLEEPFRARQRRFSAGWRGAAAARATPSSSTTSCARASSRHLGPLLSFVSASQAPLV